MRLPSGTFNLPSPTRLRALLPTLLLSLCSVASAHAACGQWQVGPALSVGGTRIGKTPDRGQIGTGVLIDGRRDGALPQEPVWDSSAAAGVELSCQQGHWRLGASFNWHFRNDWDLSVPTPSIATVTNVFTNIERAVYLLNASYVVPLGRAWQLELKAGAGVAASKLRTDYKERLVPGARPAFIRKSSDSERGFAWAMGMGLARQLNPHWQMAVHYQFLDTGAVHIRPVADRGTRFRTNINDHQLRFSLRYSFSTERSD